MPRIRGPLPRLRAKVPSVPTWRGLSLNLSVEFEYGTLSAEPVPIPFDTVVLDTDGIYNGTSGGLVPVGMGGIWRFGGHVFTNSVDGGEGGLGDCFVLQTRAAATWAGWDSYYVIGEEGVPLVRALPFDFPPIIDVLEEGDEIEICIGMSGGFTGLVQPSWSYMTMEYLGPAPVEES